MDEEFIEEIDYEFNNLVNEEFYHKNNCDYQFGEEIIKSSFRKIDSDKEKVKVLIVE